MIFWETQANGKNYYLKCGKVDKRDIINSYSSLKTN